MKVKTNIKIKIIKLIPIPIKSKFALISLIGLNTSYENLFTTSKKVSPSTFPAITIKTTTITNNIPAPSAWDELLEKDEMKYPIDINTRAVAKIPKNIITRFTKFSPLSICEYLRAITFIKTKVMPNRPHKNINNVVMLENSFCETISLLLIGFE